MTVSKDKVNRNTKDNTCNIRRISRKQANNKINSLQINKQVLKCKYGK